MRWIWIDRFVEFVPAQRATAIKNVSLAEEHVHDHWAPFPIHPAALMIEGVAQTAGVLVGQARNFKEKVILAKISRAEFDDIVVPGDQVTFKVEIETLSSEAAVTKGVVLRNGQHLGRVDLMFSHIDQNLSGIKFPKDNFVFTGQFKRLLAPFLEREDA